MIIDIPISQLSDFDKYYQGRVLEAWELFVVDGQTYRLIPDDSVQAKVDTRPNHDSPDHYGLTKT